jgi:predicted alpha/beta-fold hydrolase
MECVRVPLLVVHAADDPVEGSAQAVADVFAQVRNANCGVIMLRRGGHTGVSAFAPVYYYSLVRSFFDPRTGPRTVAIDIDIAGTADPARTKSSAAP